jgi:uncharacterized membrane protein YkvI
MKGASLFQRYLLPGLVFQSLIIAGGYGTGREIVEFFLSHGPLGGLLGMTVVSTVVFSVVNAVSFEFARVHRAYDYRRFFKALLGRGWLLFEVGYVALLIIVLAVIAAAAGTLLQETFGLPYALGVLGIMATVGTLVFAGSSTIERFMKMWSFILYGGYVTLFVWAYVRFGDAIGAALSDGLVMGPWALDGLRYSAYSLAIVPAVLFVLRYQTRRREAVVSGLLSGPIAMIPAVLFYLALIGQYPAVLDRPVPVNHLLEVLGSRTFQIAFHVMLFGTLIETGTGMIHAVNERVSAVFEERGRTMRRGLRPAMALLLLVLATALSAVGIVNLIARGYGTLTWLFIAVFVVPVMTVGVWTIVRGGELRP